MHAEEPTLPGSGLPVAGLALLTAASVGLFLVWPGLLWRAPREASHLARFAASYLSVLPLAAAMLLAVRRLSWSHLITTTGVVWSAKLVITAVLYQALARGTATDLHAVAPAEAGRARVAASAPYRSAGGDSFGAGTLRGRVTARGVPAVGAVVLLEDPPAGRPVAARATVDLAIDGARYRQPIYLVHVDDRVRLVNHDAVLHTAHFTGAAPVPPTRPLLPGAEPLAVELAERDIVRVHCDNHAGEEAWIVVVDHPYAALTGADGTYVLEAVPAGSVRVTVVSPDPRGARWTTALSVVTPGRESVADIDADTGQYILAVQSQNIKRQ